jgi:hypothetical protein
VDGSPTGRQGRTRARRRFTSRASLVQELRHGYLRDSFPRVQILIILSLAGLVAFGSSVLGLRAGLVHMGVRYPLAALVGYLAFLALIRAWIAIQRARWQKRDVTGGPDFNPIDAVDLGDLIASGAQGSEAAPFPGLGGGLSGGGGASGEWLEAVRTPPMDRAPGAALKAAGDGGWSVDVDDAWPLVLAAICVAGGVIALAYVVYAAPVLLAEVALDAALVTAAYRRLRRNDARNWIGSVVRRTWGPAVVLVVMLAVAGNLLHRAVPEARSIGGVVRALSEER